MSVLQRKAQVGKQEHQARAMTVPKALRVGLAKVADETFDMALAVIGVTRETTAAQDILADVDDDMLLLLLDGPKGVTGGMMIGGSLVSALVQQQTTGRVSATPSSARRMTATDAALCAPLVDRLFARAHGLLDMPEDQAVFPPLKFGSRAENKRLFELALEASEYTVFRLTVDIAAGIAQSNAVLILPVPQVTTAPSPAQGEASQAIGPLTLQPAVMDVAAELSANLCKLQFPLARISAFVPGQRLAIPAEAFDAVELATIDGRIICKGAMGQIEGRRALMLQSGTEASEGGSSHPDGRAPAVTEPADYKNLNLPELDLPMGDKPLDPNTLDSLSDLPEIDTGEIPALPELPDMDGAELSDLPDLADVTDLPDLPELTDTDVDLPKLNIA